MQGNASGRRCVSLLSARAAAACNFRDGADGIVECFDE
jgi:hypothetical protein